MLAPNQTVNFSWVLDVSAGIRIATCLSTTGWKQRELIYIADTHLWMLHAFDGGTSSSAFASYLASVQR